MTAILFVCMANICRSPALAATLNTLAARKGMSGKISADSCGIGWFHLGEHPNPRTFEAAKKRGVLIDHRSQQFRDEFFEEFDLILTVDSEISEQLRLRTGNIEYTSKIKLATDFSRKFKGQPIPDPYYMSGPGFEGMMDMAIDCCEGILESLEQI